MELSSVAEIAVQLTQRNSREGLSLMMVKQSAEAQKQVAGMLETLIEKQQTDSRFTLSVFA